MQISPTISTETSQNHEDQPSKKGGCVETTQPPFLKGANPKIVVESQITKGSGKKGDFSDDKSAKVQAGSEYRCSGHA
jgi:hypothetical protein